MFNGSCVLWILCLMDLVFNGSCVLWILCFMDLVFFLPFLKKVKKCMKKV